MSEVIAVLGGSGFLGSHVADALSGAGHRVRVVDRAPSPHLQDGQEMVLCDICDADGMRKALAGCSVVYHFAGMADIGAASADPLASAQVNVVGTVNALEAARRAGARRFLFASTVYVYSRHGAFYRASKQAAETYVETYGQQLGLPYTILRYGTLYGPRADGRNRVHKMLTEALATRSIDYPGNGDAMREFIHVHDAARLSVRALDPSYAGTHLILTGQERMRIRELMTMIQEILGHPIDVTFRNAEPSGHYELTPYAFMPRLAQTLVPDTHVDMGQGLLDCMNEIVLAHAAETVPAAVLEEGGG